MTTMRRAWSARFAACFLALSAGAQTPPDPARPDDDRPGVAPTRPEGAGQGATSGSGDGFGLGVPDAGSTNGRPALTFGPSVLDFGSDPGSWESWWSLNRDRYLAVKAAIYAGDAATAPEGTGVARRRPDPRVVAERAIPVLAAAVDADQDPALVGEALVALARADLGRGADDAPSSRVVERITAALAHRHAHVSESAVMALGARGSSRSIPVLAAILEDSTAGRASVGRDAVPTRTRSIAALSLGLAAARGRVDVQRYAALALTRPLQARENVPQDLAAACAAALGLVRLGGSPLGDQEMPAASSTASLARFLQSTADDASRDQIVRAHAAASAGRVAATGDETTRAYAIAWAAGVVADAARTTVVRQGAVIALARLGRPADTAADLAARKALVGLARDPDRLVRGLAWLARGEIGARARAEPEKAAALEIQTGLLAEFAEAKGQAQGFTALALGVLAHDSALVAAADGNRALKDGWERARGPSESSAIGLALGLRLDVAAAPLLAERFAREGDPRARAALALGIGLSGATSATTALRASSGGDNHPLVIRDSAVARALLGDATTSIEMLALLRGTRSLLAADYAAEALAATGDASSIDALVVLAKDPATPAARRARIVRALGAVSDASLLPWNEPLRADGHYGAAFESWNAVVGR